MSYEKFIWNNQEFHIDKLLAEVCMSVSWNIRKDWDFVIVVSGNRMVRVGKSVLAQTIAAYLCFLFKKMNINENACALNNIFFDSKEMLAEAQKMPKHSIVIYDEAREGLVAQKAMSGVQQDLLDFFNECGQLNHVFILVLPDYFVLREEMAVGRSEFLLNVFRKEKTISHDFGEEVGQHNIVSFERGFFNFYNRHAKNLLYDFYRTTHWKNYNKVKPTFPQGQFENYYPFSSKEEYDKKKLEALQRFKKKEDEKTAAKEKPMPNRYINITEQRNALIATLKAKTGMTINEIADQLRNIGCNVSNETVDNYKKSKFFNIKSKLLSNA